MDLKNLLSTIYLFLIAIAGTSTKSQFSSRPKESKPETQQAQKFTDKQNPSVLDYAVTIFLIHCLTEAYLGGYDIVPEILLLIPVYIIADGARGILRCLIRVQIRFREAILWPFYYGLFYVLNFLKVLIIQIIRRERVVFEAEIGCNP